MGPALRIALLLGPSPDSLSSEICDSLKQQLLACSCQAAWIGAGQTPPGGMDLSILILSRSGQLAQLSPMGSERLLVVLSQEAAGHGAGLLSLFPGADFLVHPFEQAELNLRLQRLAGGSDDDTALIKSKLTQRLGLERMVGRSPAFREVMDRVVVAARYDAPVLLIGESGTGKELCARALHYLSPRSGGPFLPLSCSAVPETLIENELFGHVKGAYTDASTSQQGLVQVAEGGTIFLDEIDGLATSVQSKLLRFLQEKEYRPVGAARFFKANVRAVAATNADLRELVSRSLFRQDLYHRLCVIPIELPPLRRRTGDIGLLAEHFLSKYARKFQKTVVGFSGAVEKSLSLYHWPGNVRELENVIQRAVIFATSRIIDRVELDAWPGNAYGPFQAEKEKLLRRFTRDYLRRVLTATQGNVTQAARLAGKDRRAFWELMRRYEFDKADLA
jgi:two-component system response regulator GlrR